MEALTKKVGKCDRFIEKQFDEFIFEWPAEAEGLDATLAAASDFFAKLIRLLNDGPFTTIVTGTAAEAAHYRSILPLNGTNTIDAGGLLSLEELIGLIGASDALVAASTGPLHIAAASGIRAIGLYAPRRPIHPGRWAPIGNDVHALVADPDCPACAAGKPCDCIQRISPERVMTLLKVHPLP